MFLALGVAGLILLTGTDLSVGRMVGLGMVTATIIMHNGINTGGVFGHIFDFLLICLHNPKALFALLMCVLYNDCICHDCRILSWQDLRCIHLSLLWQTCLLSFGLVTYATKGVSFGAIDPTIPNIFIPQIRKFSRRSFLGSCSNYHCMVYLEQNNIWKEPIRGRRKPGSSSSIWYFCIQSNDGSIYPGRYPVWLRLLA